VVSRLPHSIVRQVFSRLVERLNSPEHQYDLTIAIGESKTSAVANIQQYGTKKRVVGETCESGLISNPMRRLQFFISSLISADPLLLSVLLDVASSLWNVDDVFQAMSVDPMMRTRKRFRAELNLRLDALELLCIALAPVIPIGRGADSSLVQVRSIYRFHVD